LSSANILIIYGRLSEIYNLLERSINALLLFFLQMCFHCFQNNGGVIVNITAMLHQRGTALQLHAGSAKAAIG
jgi:hypothetical protein